MRATWDDGDGIKRYQLCRRIAEVFDQYLVYRPDWILAWERGQDDHWQARLWRAIRASSPGEHWAGLLRRFFAAVETGTLPKDPLPRRFSLFGLTALSPAYFDVLQALSRVTEVHLFLLNPCREYWADIVDEKGQARRRARARSSQQPDRAGTLLDLGNPLLASMGHAGQELLDQILDAGTDDEDAFVDPGASSLLHRLQADILDLRDSRHTDPSQRVTLSDQDSSLQIHVCHSPMREIQVLHDRLLRLFEEIKGLRPRDIVVMAPDIDCYAPYVAAVFGAADPGTEIPWAVADRRTRAGQPVIDALDELLGLPQSRLESSAVLGLLEVPAVQRRFGIDLSGIERIRTWVRESGIRWGADAAMRAELALPAESANTWDFGLDRLFLGYALPPGSDLYRGVAPYPDVEGSAAADLGALHELVDRLSDWHHRLQRERTAAEWRALIIGLLDAFFEPDEEEAEDLESIRAILETLEQQTVAAGYRGRLCLTMVQDQMRLALDASIGTRNILTGRVSFCSLVPMRGIPFRVVCLLGMNGEDFPRNPRPLDFDLITQEPRRGDRSRRRDDRYLFLEALLSARDLFYLSYVGNDIRDNSLKVPAVPVSELLDYVDQSFAPPDGGDLVQHLTLQHPLQPFSRRYFDGTDARLFSYAQGWLAAASAEAAEVPAAFTLDPLSAAPDGPEDVLELDDLIRFLCSPAAYFLQNRLGVRLPEDAAVPADEEPFELAGLDRYGLRQRLLELATGGADWEKILERLRAEGALPHGAFGQIWIEENAERVATFLERLHALQGEPRDPLDLDLRIGARTLTGQLRNLGSGGLVGARFRGLKAKDQLRLWVRHLVLNAVRPEGLPLASVHLGDDNEIHLGPVPDARERLADLVQLRREGLTRPLPFFPESALQWFRSGDYGSAFWKAWRGYSFNQVPGEQDDPWVRISFRGQDPLGADFQRLATRIYGPLLSAVEDPRQSEGA